MPCTSYSKEAYTMADSPFQSCIDKQNKLKQEFQACTSADALYQKIIDLGRLQRRLNPQEMVDENLVPGCQSRMYLVAQNIDGKAHFQTESDALISAGLGQLLVRIYDDESPETILKCPPSCLEELGIPSSLTPGRANGLYSLYHRMKQHAIRWLIH